MEMQVNFGQKRIIRFLGFCLFDPGRNSLQRECSFVENLNSYFQEPEKCRRKQLVEVTIWVINQ